MVTSHFRGGCRFPIILSVLPTIYYSLPKEPKNSLESRIFGALRRVVVEGPETSPKSTNIFYLDYHLCGWQFPT